MAKATKQPTANKPTANKPTANKPTANKPTAKPAAQSAASKPANQPTAKSAASKPTAKPAAQSAANKPTAKPATGAQAVAKPGGKRSAAKQRAIVAAPAAGGALLEAILAAPRDTRARLVYADALQDLGDPRGELIVLQCARAEVADDDPRAAAMDARAAELLKEHKKAWITRFGEAKGARWEFRRGFVEKLAIDAEALARIGSELLAVEPVEELAIWKIRTGEAETPSVLPAIFANPGLARVRRLSLARSKLQASDLAALAAATTLAGVEVLDLTNCMIESPGIAVLAAIESLPNLVDLRLGNNLAGDAGCEALARSPLALRALTIVRNEIGVAGATALAGARFGGTLAHLDVSTNDITSAGMRAIAESTALTALRWFKAEYCLIFDDCIDAIVASRALANLEHLDLSVNLSLEGLARVHAQFGDRLHRR